MNSIIGSLITISIIAGIYVLSALPLFFLGRKWGYERPYFAFIPILNIIMLITMAEKPMWVIILFFIPLANVLLTVVYMERIVKQYKKGHLTYSIYVLSIILAYFVPYIGIVFMIMGYALFLAFTIVENDKFGGYIGVAYK